MNKQFNGTETSDKACIKNINRWSQTRTRAAVLKAIQLNFHTKLTPGELYSVVPNAGELWGAYCHTMDKVTMKPQGAVPERAVRTHTQKYKVLHTELTGNGVECARIYIRYTYENDELTLAYSKR